jgi:hypothetical protein
VREIAKGFKLSEWFKTRLLNSVMLILFKSFDHKPKQYFV